VVARRLVTGRYGNGIGKRLGAGEYVHMNSSELDLELDGVQAMLLEEARQRAWQRRRRSTWQPSPPRETEARRAVMEPVWD